MSFPRIDNLANGYYQNDISPDFFLLDLSESRRVFRRGHIGFYVCRILAFRDFITSRFRHLGGLTSRPSLCSCNMAAPYVKPTRQHNAAARLIRRARMPIVSMILLWKISLT